MTQEQILELARDIQGILNALALTNSTVSQLLYLKEILTLLEKAVGEIK